MCPSSLVEPLAAPPVHAGVGFACVEVGSYDGAAVDLQYIPHRDPIVGYMRFM